MFFFNATIVEEGPKQLISCHVNNINFAEFCDVIYQKSSVRIFYDEPWVTKLRVSMDEDSILVVSAVKLALKGSGLEVSIWNDNLIILPGAKLLKEIPRFELKNRSHEFSDENTETLTESEERYIKGRKADVLETIQVGSKGSVNGNSIVKVRGRVLNKDNGEPIIGATMYVVEAKIGKMSDQNGFFTIVIKPGKYNVSFESMGFEKKKYLLNIIANGDFKIELDKAVLAIEEIIVHGDRQIDIKSRDPGLLKISPKTIKEIPTMMGERDILKVSEMLPGIVSVGEGSAGLNVRGGNSDQNAFYINKIPIYNTSHLFGFFPAFNSEIIKDFSIYKGHVPAKYGGRLSSVFNIITRQGNRKKFTVHGGINPITASLTAEGPIKKDVSSILLSARSSYSDWILSRIPDPTIRTSSANFNDFSAAVNYDFKKTQLSAFAYHSYDYFKLSDINEYNYSNSGASVNVRHDFGPSFWGEFAVIGSQYAFETTDKQQISSAYQHKYKIEHYEFRGDFDHIFNENHTLKYGTSIILYKLNRGEVVPFGVESLRSVVNLGTEQGVESAVYFSDLYNVLPWLDLTLGLRYSMFTPIGPQTVYTYTEGAPLDDRYVEDSLSYGSNQPIKWYPAPEVRAVINIETDSRGSVKLAFNQMHQNLFMLSNTITVAPNTQWKLADYHLQPSSSNQFSLGVFRNFLKGGWESSVELFYKKTNNATEFKDGADFLASPKIETTVLQGDQQAYGLEFFLKRSSRKLDGWLSYTYSRSFVKVDGEHAWDKINQGEIYPSNYDIPHAINTVINYHLRRRITASTVLTYQTGRPITYPIGVYYVDEVAYTDYSKRNEYRIPDYFRVDVSLTLEGNLKKHKLIHSSWMFSIYNLTGRKNPYSIYFESENGRINSYKYSVIGVPFFTITWLFKLGNYASD